MLLFLALGTFRVFRILRICLRSTDGTYCRILTIYMENLAVKRQYFVLIASSISIIFVASGLITVTEGNVKINIKNNKFLASVTPQLKNFHTALYFIIVVLLIIFWFFVYDLRRQPQLVMEILHRFQREVDLW